MLEMLIALDAVANAGKSKPKIPVVLLAEYLDSGVDNILIVRDSELLKIISDWDVRDVGGTRWLLLTESIWTDLKRFCQETDTSGAMTFGKHYFEMVTNATPAFEAAVILSGIEFE